MARRRRLRPPALTGVREVTVGGRVTAASARRVPGTWLAAAVRDGLVILHGRALRVWDPRTGRTVRRLGLAAVTESRGDVLLGCTARCRRLAVADAAAARTVVARSPAAGGSTSDARCRRTAGWLAAPAAPGAALERRAGRARAPARRQRDPGSQSGRAYPLLAWARSSGWLFIRGRGGPRARVPPGAAARVRLPLRLPREAADFVAG